MGQDRSGAAARQASDIAAVTSIADSARAGDVTPPRAPRRAQRLVHFGDERVDEWYWLRDRADPTVRAYLEAENEHTHGALAHLAGLRDRLLEEIRRHVEETDVSAPVPDGAFEYYARTLEGSQYPVLCRRPRGAVVPPDARATPGSESGEEVLIDENLLAAGHDFFAIGGFAISPDERLLAYSTDTRGGERFTVRVRDLHVGADFAEEISDTSYGLAWANDSATLLYIRPDATERPWQVWRHTLGSDPGNDALVLQEDDGRFHVSLERSRTGSHLVITSSSKTTSEVWLVDADDPAAPPAPVAGREEGVEYHVEYHRSARHGNRLFIVTNCDSAENFKLVVTPAGTSGREHWQDVIEHRDDVRLEDVAAFAGHVVVAERAEGLTRLRVLRLRDGDEHVIAMPEDVYAAGIGQNREFDTALLRYEYTSLVTPRSSFDYDVDTRTATLVKCQQVPGYDAGRYETRRLFAVAADGTRVPISLVRPVDGIDGSPSPLLLYGYGSYEVSIEPTFSATRLSLLERGVAYAIAHVRGGGEGGREWYEQGKLDRKRNTFDDFVACAECLVAEGYTRSDRLAARGGSAGGLLMGAVANARPDMFRAIVAEVPFVDCLTTMLDASLPLTITEWEEWGNPVADERMYRYIKAYSPYDNVGAHDYPALLVTGGLNDPRVQYWEPAKWVAKLRATKTDDRLLVLRTEMGAGHSGPSGRYDAWRDEAFVLAFVLDQLASAD